MTPAKRSGESHLCGWRTLLCQSIYTDGLQCTGSRHSTGHFHQMRASSSLGPHLNPSPVVTSGARTPSRLHSGTPSRESVSLQKRKRSSREDHQDVAPKARVRGKFPFRRVDCLELFKADLCSHTGETGRSSLLSDPSEDVPSLAQPSKVSSSQKTGDGAGDGPQADQDEVFHCSYANPGQVDPFTPLVKDLLDVFIKHWVNRDQWSSASSDSPDFKWFILSPNFQHGGEPYKKLTKFDYYMYKVPRFIIWCRYSIGWLHQGRSCKYWTKRLERRQRNWQKAAGEQPRTSSCGSTCNTA